MRFLGEEPARLGGDLGGFGKAFDPGQRVDPGGEDIGVLRSFGRGLGERRGEIRLSIRQAQPCKKGQSGDETGRLLRNLLRDDARAFRIAHHIQRLRLAKVEVRVAGICAKRGVKPGERILFAAFQGNPRPQTQRNRRAGRGGKRPIQSLSRAGQIALIARPDRGFKQGFGRRWGALVLWLGHAGAVPLHLSA